MSWKIGKIMPLKPRMGKNWAHAQNPKYNPKTWSLKHPESTAKKYTKMDPRRARNDLKIEIKTLPGKYFCQNFLD